MSHQDEAGYAFGDRLPLNQIRPGTMLYVSGASMGPAERLALSLVLAGAANDDEGMVLVSPTTSPRKLLRQCEPLVPGGDTSRIGLIDCTGQEQGDLPFDGRVETLSSPQDLTGIGIQVSSLQERLRNNGFSRARIGMLSISTLLMYRDLRTVFRFLHTISGRIDASRSLGVFVVDEESQDAQTRNVLGQLADGRVEVRDPQPGEDADGELRVRGLPDQPDGWTPFALGR